RPPTAIAWRSFEAASKCGTFCQTLSGSCMRSLVLLAPVLGFVACHAPPAIAQASNTAPAAVCIYQGKTYSAAAAICPQARLMQICSLENDKLIWKVVADPALANLCVTPTVTVERPGRRRHVVRRLAPSAARAAAQVTPATPPKCFMFNNRRYCE